MRIIFVLDKKYNAKTHKHDVLTSAEVLKKERMHMNNKGIGSIFCLIAAILTAARYMAAAMFMSNVSSWDAGLFASGLEYIGPELKIASIIALVVGIVFLGAGIYQDIKEKRNE